MLEPLQTTPPDITAAAEAAGLLDIAYATEDSPVGRLLLATTPQGLVTISYIDREPKLAYDVVQKLITIFIESATGNNRAEMDNAQQFIEQIAERL